MVNAKEAQLPWSGRQTCSSTQRVRGNGIPDVVEIADQYILPQDNSDKEVLASELLVIRLEVKYRMNEGIIL